MLYVKDITTGKVTQLTDNFENAPGVPTGDGAPVWSPDGTKIAFSRKVDDGTDSPCSAVFVMDADGSDEKQLTDGCDRPDAWSPDGSKIAYSRCFEQCHIWVVNPDGTDERSIANSAIDERNANWKPNGRKIVYELAIDGEIWKMNPDGSSKVRLSDDTSAGKVEEAPIWSPNGRKIIFIRGDGEGGHVVMKMNPDGSNKTIVPNLPSTEGEDWDWQPSPTP
jgi:Tol biopolymer transport system component